MGDFYNVEEQIRLRPASVGIVKAFPIMLSAFYNGASGAAGINLAAVGAGTVGYALDTDGARCIEWDDTADASDIASIQIALPEDFTKSRGVPEVRDPGLRFLFQVRKVDTTGSATENADLEIQAVVRIQAPNWQADGDEAGDGEAVETLTTKSFVLPAKTTLATEESRRWVELDVLAQCTDAQKLLLRPGTLVTVDLKPNEAVGTALSIRLTACQTRYKGSLKPVYDEWCRPLH